jgi:hypothetical protein
LGAPAPQWISLDLGAGNAISPTALKLCPDSAAASDYPISFLFQGSNTGAFAGEETVLYTASNYFGWVPNTFSTFTF